MSVSPKPTAWKRDAKSWNPSGRFRMIRRKRLILHGLKSVRVSEDASSSLVSLAYRGDLMVVAVEIIFWDSDARCAPDGTKPWAGTVPRVAPKKIASALGIVILEWYCVITWSRALTVLAAIATYSIASSLSDTIYYCRDSRDIVESAW